jgi:hypothetical protein
MGVFADRIMTVAMALVFAEHSLSLLDPACAVTGGGFAIARDVLD